MRILKPKTIAALALLLLLLPATHAVAQGPAYLHAISDLRAARAYIQTDTRPVWTSSRQHAIDEITKAIQDMKVAAADDGKNLSQTPPPQGRTDPNAPLHSALKLLDEAYQDVSRGQDYPQNAGLQARSLRHIDVARLAIHHFIDQVQ